jgi:pyruvate dehydrogenase E2 component (dihydrolipoamide acetyltransferase)
VKKEASLVTLESDKATMEVPSPRSGTVRGQGEGGRPRERGSLVLSSTALPRLRPCPVRRSPPRQPGACPRTHRGASAPRAPPRSHPCLRPRATRRVAWSPHASPSVRKLARELGADLARVEASGPRGRILHADVQRFVKEVVTAAATGGAGVGLDIAPWPKVDFAKYGPVETKPLSRIKKISRTNLARNWVMIPHVTQHDEADITELERFRVELNAEHAKDGVKVTLLAFLVKACVAALRRFPDFNASLEGDQLVLKGYFHIGFAADTPSGLVVPVVKDADRKGVLEIARELAELAQKAREGKLQLADMQGGTFSISSLGGIGGTAFTPIINAPEVAILGVSRGATRPVWDGAQFAPRLMLPLSLSYDHRVVDGAAAARFTSYLAQLLADMRRAML